MSIVKHRNTYHIIKKLAGSGEFEDFINIQADPDEIRVVQVMYIPDTQNTVNAQTGDAAKQTDGNAVFRVGWDGVSSCLFLFDVGHDSSNTNIRINTHGKILRGDQKFTVYDQNNKKDTTLNGHIAFIFEAITY